MIKIIKIKSDKLKNQLRKQIREKNLTIKKYEPNWYKNQTKSDFKENK